MPRRSMPVIVVLVVVALLCACSTSGSDRTKSVESGTLSAPSTGPSLPLLATAPASASPTPTASPSPTATATTTGDFTDVTYAIPNGYSKVPDGLYSPAVALEATYKAYYFTPNTDPLGKQLLSVFVYTLPAGKTVSASTNQIDRVKAYNKQLKATIRGAINKRTVAGRTAYEESVSQPPDYTYLAWFVFGTGHFMEYTCQFTSSTNTSTFSADCTSMLLSLQTTA